MVVAERVEADSITLRVMFEDTDCTGRVHFSKYAIWIDNGIVNYFRRRKLVHDRDGSMVDQITGNRVAFAIGEYHARIEKPSKLGDLIKVEVKPAEIRRRVVVFEGIIESYPDGQVLARGRITLIHIDPRAGKSKDIPGWLVERLRSQSL